MSREVTGPLDPFEGGFAISLAIESGGIFDHPVATIAIVDDGITFASVIATSFFVHENTLYPCLYRLTNHGYLLPSLFLECAKTQKKPSSPMRLIAHFEKELDFSFKEKFTGP